MGRTVRWVSLINHHQKSNTFVCRTTGAGVVIRHSHLRFAVDIDVEKVHIQSLPFRFLLRLPSSTAAVLQLRLLPLFILPAPHSADRHG